jgi:hypothetical protein
VLDERGVALRHQVRQLTDAVSVDADLDAACPFVLTGTDRAPHQFRGDVPFAAGGDGVARQRALVVFFTGDGDRYVSRHHRKTRRRVLDHDESFGYLPRPVTDSWKRPESRDAAESSHHRAPSHRCVHF